MKLTEGPYFIIISVVITLMALHWLYRCLSSFFNTRHSCLGRTSPYHLFLRYLVYPRATFRLLQIDTLSPLGFVLLIFYFAGTAIFNFVGATTTAEKGVRAAQLALANLIPLYFSSGREFGAHILGISLETYGIIHRTTGFMAALQAAIHVTIGYQNNAFNLSSPTGFNGLLVGFKSHINAQCVLCHSTPLMLQPNIHINNEIGRMHAFIAFNTSDGEASCL